MSLVTCRRCGTRLGPDSEEKGICPNCETREQAAFASEALRASGSKRIIMTTESSSGLPILDRLGILSAECVMGMNVFKDLGAGLRDIFGGRSESYQTALREAREAVLSDLRRQAVAAGADAVVAISMNYSEISGGGKSMLFLVGTGTAVTLESPPAARAS